MTAIVERETSMDPTFREFRTTFLCEKSLTLIRSLILSINCLSMFYAAKGKQSSIIDLDKAVNVLTFTKDNKVIRLFKNGF